MKLTNFLPLALAALAGCTTVPPTNVHQPMTARPTPRMEAMQANGAIYQASYSRPLFEDRRARYVGDTLTVKITESTSASTKSDTQAQRSDTVNASITNLAGVPGKGLVGLGVNGTSSTNFSGKGEDVNNNAFTGSMTVTVIEVLPNGNLLVSGEKQLAIGRQQEFVRVSGVVNPAYVDASNTVQSAQIADARIEYKSAGFVSEAQVMGWLARFFLSVLPF